MGMAGIARMSEPLDHEQLQTARDHPCCLGFVGALMHPILNRYPGQVNEIL